MVDTNSIRIKGIREGILVVLDEGLATGANDKVLQQIEQELAEKQGFLEGSRVVLDVGVRLLNRSDLAEIQSLLNEKGLELWTVLAGEEETRESARTLGLATRLPGSNTDLDGNILDVDEAVDLPAPEPAVASNALLLRETIRSGRSIYHEGDVVIVGDVNPGAEIIAGGDVIVWGRLRGLVHAGAMGDNEAIICALELTPTQLRIGNKIAVPPEDRQGPPVPETASIRDGQIVADPWRR